MTDQPDPPKGVGRLLLIAGLGGAVVFVAMTLVQRNASEARLAERARENTIPFVKLVAPHRETGTQTLSLPGAIAAFYDASIHAQVSGYIKTWRRTMGERVQKNEVLAEVDTPELDERLAQAREELTRAQAALALAKTTAERWADLRGSSAVSRQSSDEKQSDRQVKEADAGAASANLERLKAQKAFAQIVAPFDGVLTARNIDIGSYVGPNRNGEPLFKIADIHEMRIHVNVPQFYAERIKLGMIARFTTPQWPGRAFTASVATTANAIGARTGALLVELRSPNDDGALLPGAYADVRFDLPVDPNQLRIAASALIVDAGGVRAAIVDGDNRVHFRKLAIAVDLGGEAALESGLSPEDRVIDNPAETLAEGDLVRIGGQPEAPGSAAPGAHP